jgi:uncharacterized protein
MSKVPNYKPLCAAIAKRDAAKLRKLAHNDSDAAAHWKPIMDAAFAGRADLVGVLIDAGADPNVVAGTPGRHTPLVRALQHHSTIPKHAGHEAVVELLLQRGADSNLPAGPHALAPVGYAAVGGSSRCIELLRQHGADMNVHLAAALYESARMRRYLKDACAVNARDERGRTPLHYVAFSGLWRDAGIGSAPALACARLLIDRGAELDAEEQVGDEDENFHATPLWRAVGWQKHAALARLLLEAGANPNNAVFAATFDGTEALLELLNEFNADWNLPHEGDTPIIELMYYKRPAAVPWLLAHGADPNYRGRKKLTALHYAAMQGVKEDYVAALLKAGAKRDLKDSDGKTALDHAREKGRARAVAMLSAV